MSIPFIVALGACGMLAILVAGLFAYLVFNSPLRSGWMRSRWAVDGAILVLVAAALLDFGLELRVLVANGVDPLLAQFTEFAFISIAAAVLWKAMHIAERISAGKAGLSPFTNLDRIREHMRRHPMPPVVPCRPAGET